VTHVFGDYWDVYRMAFLSGKKVIGIPFPMYPNRFPGWSRGLGPDHGKLLILRPRAGHEMPQSQWPSLVEGHNTFPPAATFDWRRALLTVWKADGRDPTELKRVRVVVPSPDPSGH
jgi:hypothetical protein